MSVSEKYRAIHDAPNGPDDSRPSALQIINDEGLQGKLHGTVALVTGAAGGLGLEIVRALHAAGCHVCALHRLCCLFLFPCGTAASATCATNVTVVRPSKQLLRLAAWFKALYWLHLLWQLTLLSRHQAKWRWIAGAHGGSQSHKGSTSNASSDRAQHTDARPWLPGASTCRSRLIGVCAQMC